MKRIATIIALALSMAAFAAVETVELLDGGTWTASAGRLAAVRVVSTAASGAFALKGVEGWSESTNVTETVTTATPVWRRVMTNQTETVTNTYSGQVVYTPPPPWLVKEEGWATNSVTTTVTRRMKTGRTIMATNTLVSATCSGGAYTNAPSGVWLSDGEAVTFSFSTANAFGRALLVIER